MKSTKYQRGFLLNPYRFAAPTPPPTDPDWANVVSLLHFDGADGSTTFTDETGLAWSIYSGTPSITVSQSKFGGSSLGILPPSRIRSTDSIAIATGTTPFTIEAWVRFVTGASATNFIYVYGIFAFTYTTGTGYLSASASNARQSTGTLLPDVWYHIAISRTGNVAKFFINGVQQGANITSFGSGSRAMYLGGDNTGYTSSCFLDDVRLTVGVSRYTSNFTPPTDPFPNTGP